MFSMGIGPIGANMNNNYSYSNSLNKQMMSSMEKLASGNRINKAADDPAGLAIAAKMTSQLMGTNQTISNQEASKDLLNTADGALESIQGNLARLKELSVKANNSTLTAEDKGIIQNEVNSIKDQIQQTASTTQFNQISVLQNNGSQPIQLNIGDAGGKNTITVNTNTSLSNLGISDFDVTKDFDIKAVDSAMEKVSEARSNVGSAMNAFQYSNGTLNSRAKSLLEAKSAIESANVETEASNLKRTQMLNQYKLQAQQMTMMNNAQVPDMFKQLM